MSGYRHSNRLLQAGYSVMLVIGLQQSIMAQGSPETTPRDGFTVMASMGIANQVNMREEVSNWGPGGASVGFGSFLNKRWAVMGRLSQSRARFRDEWWTSGVLAMVFQYWPGSHFKIEAGSGYGFYTSEDQSSRGLGLVFGTGISVLQVGRTSVQLGFEVTPVLTNADPQRERFTMNYGSLAFTLGIQRL